MKSLAVNSTQLAPVWNTFQKALPVKLTTIHSAAEYNRMTAFMNSLLDIVGDDDEHVLADLLDLTGRLVEDYERAHHAIPDAAPQEVLRFLMRQHDLKQSDLGAEVGGQSVVSSILNGDREINARQARALAARFGVSVAAFI